jgi:hypothetical protein
MRIECSRFVTVLALALLIGCDDSDYQTIVTAGDAGDAKGGVTSDARGDAPSDAPHTDGPARDASADITVPPPDAGAEAPHTDAGADDTADTGAPTTTDARTDDAPGSDASSDSPVDTAAPGDTGADDATDAQATTTDGSSDTDAG